MFIGLGLFELTLNGHFRNHARRYGLCKTYDVRLGVDKGRTSCVTVGDRQVPEGLPVKTDAIPARQLDVVHVGGHGWP